MMNNTMSVAIFRPLYEVGVIIEGIDESKDIPIYYITVPEFSTKKTLDDKCIANQYLVERFEEAVTLTLGKCVVKSSIREGETWTEDKATEAINNYDDHYRYTK